MLFTYLKGVVNDIVLLVLLALFILPVFASNFQTVPQWMRPATTASSQHDKKARQKSLTVLQQKGYRQGADVATLMQQQFGKNKAAHRFAKNITTHWQHHEQHIIQALASHYGTRATKTSPTLYYFISFSMPKVLIQAYMLDAIWNGGILVLRGVTPGMSIATFIRERLMPLVAFKGAHARITIDPNLFEQYQITRVPTILVTIQKPLGQGCHAILTPLNKHSVVYQRCLPASPNHYWSLSGSVSTRWALSELAKAGAPSGLFLARLKGLHEASTQKAVPFSGDWKSAPMPYSNSDIDALLRKLGKGQSRHGAIGAMAVIDALSGGDKPHA